MSAPTAENLAEAKRRYLDEAAAVDNEDDADEVHFGHDCEERK